MASPERCCRRRGLLRRVGGSIAVTAVGLAGCGSSDRIASVRFVHESADGTPTTATTVATTAADAPYRLIDGGVRWHARPVEFALATDTVPPDLSTGRVQRAIAGALDTWNAVSGADAVFHPPRFSDSLSGATHGNGVNEVAWTDGLGDAIARATIRWNTERERLLEVDVELDTATAWTTRPDRDPDAYDVRSLLTHELGHNGLRDVHGDPAQTMYHESAPGETRKRTLEAGDVAGWRRLYG